MKNEIEDVEPESPAATDASTRSRVSRSILQHGPSTATDLAARLGLTPAAVRRHLTVLTDSDQVASRQQRVYGRRGRGRPAKVFELTDAGRATFFQAYDQLAISALRHLQDVGGEEAVDAFAAWVAEPILERFEQMRPEYDTSAEALVEALTAQGFVASLQPIASGVQLCQFHCPVAHVATEFPQLCEAETRVFGELLGSHVQRLATIAHGDGVCTTHVPRPVRPAGAEAERKTL
ncbi:MAG TPA: transcriptional regulator [Propionibacteriaceae bacterium]|nr:transcriptional regulator [Propionibacteriaceae bacterium]